jgi:hypothetical protein
LGSRALWPYDSANAFALYRCDGLDRRITKSVQRQGYGMMRGSTVGATDGLSTGEHGGHHDKVSK